MTTWLHPFLALKVRKEISVPACSLGHRQDPLDPLEASVLGTPRAAVELSQVRIPVDAPEELSHKGKGVPCQGEPAAGLQHLPLPLKQGGTCHRHRKRGGKKQSGGGGGGTYLLPAFLPSGLFPPAVVSPQLFGLFLQTQAPVDIRHLIC